ncbi:DUF2075 domain-containing protein [Leucobacter denitrificans]|uniref:DUF2075 domain-containing protein n=1 Tax=Leucobacter denitrificans TaxID=683042 RepID=A0A7G9S6A8_9MICO|nr:DUF2075 domain-containing protein [Leucobacter denitrificans]QNN63383.1 DUF2075 domain-containing protein [Leucobacter denitrificans]
MTGFSIEKFDFTASGVTKWGQRDRKHSNWPVVYTISDTDDLYIGETLNGVARLNQHLATEAKHHLERVQVVVDETFNKSACLDLESFLIRLFAGDGKFRVLNRNDGITDSDYFSRERYRETFVDVFDQLRSEGYFTRTIPEIENSDLFKLSPFKALTHDQAIAAEDILEGLFKDIESGIGSTIVVQGNPGTGKTILAIYLMKLLSDIQHHDYEEQVDQDSMFADFFVPGHRELLTGFRIGLVIPQQSLRASIQAVFKRVPGLSPDMVLTPFDVGEATEKFDLLIVDEAHRLNRRSAQAMGTLTKQFGEINDRLFGPNGAQHSQLDWIEHQSAHQLFLIDSDQAVRPADLPRAELDALISVTESKDRFYRLVTQMRVRAEADYVGFVKEMLAGGTPDPQDFGEYDLRFFDDFDEMRREVLRRNEEFGLSRLVAGYAWKWKSRTDKQAYDIEIGESRLQWNRTMTDWVNSKTSVNEVGSIHTIQGYDLNYAGVIIGGDLVLDPISGRTRFERSRYFDARGKANNNMLGIKFSDEDLLEYVRNIYAVLLTRGIRGTYIWIEDETLRERVRKSISLLPTHGT